MKTLALLWFGYVLRWLMGRRRFVCATPPSLKRQLIIDRLGLRRLPVYIRDLDDWIQLEHIFLNEEYNLQATGRMRQIEEFHRQLLLHGAVPLILDIGANIGLAARYFDHIFPSSRIVGVEPDVGNYEAAKRNLTHGISIMRAAIGSEDGRGQVISFGRNNAFRVERTKIGGDVQFVTVDTLLAMNDDATPFIVKIDIEGFERDLFSRNTDWVDRFPILIIELHDWMLPGARVTQNFLTDISRREREFMHFDGYVVSIADLGKI